MSEKLTAKQAAEQLLYKPEYAADKRADASPNGGAYTAAAFGDGDRRTGSDRHERHHALYDDL